MSTIAGFKNLRKTTQRRMILTEAINKGELFKTINLEIQKAFKRGLQIGNDFKGQRDEHFVPDSVTHALKAGIIDQDTLANLYAKQEGYN
jgi:hypothetical protein